MGGTYRKIMHRPTNFSHQLLRYDDADQDLASTDEDKLIGRSNIQPADLQSGKHLALRLEFTLSSSTYATMALREITKGDTSSATQRGLTEAMQERLAVSKGAPEDMAVDAASVEA
jgi:tRNA pseudouridine13 synthase